jgi:hypothetical protein
MRERGSRPTGSRRSVGDPKDRSDGPNAARPTVPARAPHDLGRLPIHGAPVGPVDHPLEAEATRLAAQLVGSAPPPDSARSEAGPTSARLPAVSDHLGAGGGRPLPPSLRADLEARLGADLGAVRIHDDAAAAQLAAATGAAAVTLGSDIAFGENQFDPHTSAGRLLIAHELVHVAQQGRAPASVQADPEGVARRVPLEGLSARHDLEAQEITARDRGTTAGAGPGPSAQSLKDAGYDYLIEQVRAAREGYTAWLHEQAGSLPTALQPTVHEAIDVSDANLAVLVDLLFFDVGLVVGVGEAVVDTVLGIVAIAATLLEVAFHYFLGTIFAVQTALVSAGLVAEADEELIRPLAEDLDAAWMLWFNLCSFDVIGFLEAWRTEFVTAPQERKAAMVGEFVGQLAAFVVTWEAASARGLTVRLPLPPAAAPEMVAAVAGGGSVPVALELPAVSVNVGGPLTGGGAAVAAMSGRGRDDRPRELTDEEKWQEMEESMRKQKTLRAQEPAEVPTIPVVATGIADTAFADAASAIQAAVRTSHPDWVNLDRIKIKDIESFGFVEDPDKIQALLQIGEDPARWESLHYVATYGKGSEEVTVSLFRKTNPDGRSYTFRGPHL